MLLPALFALILASVAVHHRAEPAEHPQAGKNKTANPQSAEAPAVNQPPAQTTQTGPKQEQHGTIEKWFNPNTIPNWVIALITAIYVAATIGQLVAIRRQAKFARRTLRAMNRQGTTAKDTLTQLARQADLMEKTQKSTDLAARAAAQSTQIADRQTTLIFQNERAWIVIKPLKPVNWPLPDKSRIRFPLIYDFIWSAVNVGRTPAFIKEISITVKVRPVPQPNEDIDYAAPQKVSNFIVAPNADHSQRHIYVMPEVEYDSVKRGESCIAFYGFVKYDDTLENKEHISCFCAYWRYAAHGTIEVFEPVGPEGWTKYT